MTTALVIANADAGSADDEVLGGVLDALRGEWEAEVARTGSPEDLRSVLDGTDVDVIVVAGGDGSLHATVQALHDLDRLADATLALVPLGTGNDFARTLGIDPDAVTAARTLLESSARPLDVAVDDDDHVVVNAVHVGLGAQAGREAEPWKRRLGPLGYAVGALKAGFLGTPARLQVSVDGKPLTGGDDVVQAAVGIGRFVGGGAPLLPDADPCDGQLEVVVSRANPPARRLAYGLRLLKGSHTTRRDVTSARARTVTVTGDPMVWNSDGEIGEGMRERTWRVVPGAYRMLVPPGFDPDAQAV